MTLQIERLPAFLYLTFAILLSSRFVDVYLFSESLNFEFLASALFLIFFLTRIFFYRNTKSIPVFYIALTSYIYFQCAFLGIRDGIESSIGTRFLLFMASSSALPLMLGFSKPCEEAIYKCVDRVTWLVCSYGWYQFAGGILGWPTGSEIFRGRQYGAIQQVSSFFDEPAFLAQFLVVILYINLCVRKEPNWKIIFALCTIFLLSFSVFGVSSMFILLSFYLLESIFLKRKSRNIFIGFTRFFKKYKVILIAILMILPMTFNIISLNSNLLESDVNPISVVQERLVNETFSTSTTHHEEVIGNDPRYAKISSGIYGQSSSAYISSSNARVINEINFLFLTLREKPFFGFGINYDSLALNRPMALNALTEIMVRWGIIGLGLFLGLIIFEKLQYQPKYPVCCLVFMVLLFFGDGAIATPMFWLLLSLVLLMERLNTVNQKPLQCIDTNVSYKELI